MSTQQAYEDLIGHWKELQLLESCAAVLGWGRTHVYAPRRRGAPRRTARLAGRDGARTGDGVRRGRIAVAHRGG